MAAHAHKDSEYVFGYFLPLTDEDREPQAVENARIPWEGDTVVLDPANADHRTVAKALGISIREKAPRAQAYILYKCGEPDCDWGHRIDLTQAQINRLAKRVADPDDPLAPETLSHLTPKQIQEGGGFPQTSDGFAWAARKGLLESAGIEGEE